MRLIDADVLKERLKEYCIDGDEQAMQWYDIMGIDETIDNAPTIDAVPVVRCGDCLFCHRFANDSNDDIKSWCLRFLPKQVNDDDFCAWGERKDDE